MVQPAFESERELIVITQAAVAVRAAPSGVESAVASAAVTPLAQALAAAGATLLPCFGIAEERLDAQAARLPAAARSPVSAPYSSFHRVRASDDQLDGLAAQLMETEAVEAAYVAPPAEPPVFGGDADAAGTAPAASSQPPAATPDFSAQQGYLEAAPGGIDARYAWTVPGGTGAGVGIVDIEGAWQFTHEDLLQNQGGVIGGTQQAQLVWRNHGTAVVGEFGGDATSFGVTGITPDANVRAIAAFGPLTASGAIVQAALASKVGDIVLIELHRPGPRFGFTTTADQSGFIAMEWWPDVYAAIRFATARGVVVVEAAGNGGEDFDDALYDTPAPGFPPGWFNPFAVANPSSEAVLVGAGAPPPGTHGRNHGDDRSRLGFSNYGARVDAQGWGREVTTTGYGDLQDGPSEDVWYTDVFSGTSSASPIVVGALAAVQGAARAAGRQQLTSAQAINMLRATGSPQQSTAGRPASQRIGNRPDLRQMITHSSPVPLPWPGVYLKYPPLTTHASVAPWQTRMVQRGFTLVIDGKYGKNSKSACVGFQKDAGLQADGIVGPKTWDAVFA